MVSLLCMNKSPTLNTIIWDLHSITLQCILVTLLFRLYYIFKESTLEITKIQKWLFIIIYIIGILCIITTDADYFIYDANEYIMWIAAAIGMVIYFGLSIYGMILFTLKMNRLFNMEKSEGHQSIHLLNTTRKYVTLLSFSILSSWIVCLCIVVLSVFIHSDNDIVNAILASIVCIDSVINVICLWLQYRFNQRYYDKYCGTVSTCCVYLIARRRANDDEIRLSTANDDVISNEIHNQINV